MKHYKMFTKIGSSSPVWLNVVAFDIIHAKNILRKTYGGVMFVDYKAY